MLVQNAKFKVNRYSSKLKVILVTTNVITLMAISPFSILHSPFQQQAYAVGTNLKLSPSSIRIQAQPPADVHAPFTIENPSENPISLKIGYKLFDSQNSQNGTVTFLKNGSSISGQDQKFFEKVQVIDSDNFSHDIIELGPKQRKQLMLRINLPSGQSSADYYFSLVFLENITQIDQTSINRDKNQQPSAITLQSGIGTNVFLAVGPKEGPQASIDTYETPWLKLGGPVPFLLRVSNDGTHYISPSGTVTIKNMFGQTVDKVQIPKSVILAGTSRTFTSTTSQTTATDKQLLAGSTIVWPEKFLLGVYTATLDLSLSDEGPVVTKSIRFTVLPLIFILGFILLIAALSYIYLRIKKKLHGRQ